jgi:hypothetical protein
MTQNEVPNCLSNQIGLIAEGVPITGFQLVGRQLSTDSSSLGATSTPDHSAKAATSIGDPVTRDNIVVARCSSFKVMQIQPIGTGAAGTGGRIVAVGARAINPCIDITQGSAAPTLSEIQAAKTVVRQVLLDFTFILSAITLPADSLNLYAGGGAGATSQLGTSVRLGTGITIIEDNTPQTGFTLDGSDATIIKRSEIRTDGITEKVMALADQDEWLEFYLSREDGDAGITNASSVGVLLSRG